MPNNDFKPFSFAATARVLSQSAWAADVALVNGFPSGILTKERLNKAIRQPSVIAAAVAEVVGTRINEDMLDDGDFAKLVRQIDAAFSSGGGTTGTVQSLRLKTTGIAFVYQDATSSVSTSPPITFTVEMVGFTGVVSYTAQARDAAGVVLGNIALGGVPPAATLTSGQFLTFPGTQYVVVTASVDVGTGVMLTDTETIYKSVNGDGALQIRLTNANVTLPALADGTVVSYTTAVGTLEAYKGQTLLSNLTTPAVTFSLAGYTGFNTVYPAAQAGISINPVSGAYSVSGGMTSDAALVQIRCTFSTGGFQDAFFILSKSRQGQPGPSGSAPRVDLSTTNQLFVTPSNSTTPVPASVNITALTSNVPSPSYQWRIDGVVQGNTSPVLVLPSFAAGGAPKVVRCDVTGSDSSTAFDSMTIYSLKDGDDAIKAGLDNESRTIACTADGTPTAGLPILSQIVVVRGATVINNTNGVTYQLASSSGFTGMSLSASGAIEITGMSAETAEANYTITLNGVVYPAGKLIAIKSRSGAAGTDAIVDQLTNGSVSVPASSDGTVSSYASATGTYRVTKGALTLTDLTTPSVVFSLAGYTGFNTVYPAAQAGISINAVTGEYAVTGGLSSDSGTVTFRATISGVGVREQIFTVTKSKQGSGSVTFSLTPTEALLPTDLTGAVVSFADAKTTARVLDNGVDVTGTWTLSKSDKGLVSSLVGTQLSITSLIEPGTMGAVIGTSINTIKPGDWSSFVQSVYGDGVWCLFGVGPAPWTSIGKTADYQSTVSFKTAPTSGRWQQGAFAKGVFLAIELGVVGTNKLLRSTDKGETWLSNVTLSASAQWSSIAANHDGAALVAANGSTTGCRSLDGGATWANVTMPGTSCTLYPCGGTRFIAQASNGNWYTTVDNGSNWSAAFTTLPGLTPGVHTLVQPFGFLSGMYFLVQSNNGTGFLLRSGDNGVTWTRISLPGGTIYDFREWQIVKGVLYISSATTVTESYFSTDGVVFKKAPSPANWITAQFGAVARSVESRNAEFMSYASAADGTIIKAPILSTDPNGGSVTVTATKAGAPGSPMSIVFPVRKAAGLPDLYTASLSPAVLPIPSTSDGVVTSYATATVTGDILKNGISDVNNWAVSWVTSDPGLVPTSGTGPVATFTSMAANLDSARVTFTAKKSGFPDVVGWATVIKTKGAAFSGVQATAFNAFGGTDTHLTLRFKRDARFQIRRGAAGAFVDAGFWYMPPSATIGDTHYLRVDTTGAALSSGTTGVYQQLNTDRDFTLSSAVPGTHRTDLTVRIGPNNTGAGAGLATGSLVIDVP